MLLLVKRDFIFKKETNRQHIFVDVQRLPDPPDFSLLTTPSNPPPKVSASSFVGKFKP